MENTYLGLIIAVVALIFAAIRSFRTIRHSKEMLKISAKLVEDLKNKSAK